MQMNKQMKKIIAGLGIITMPFSVFAQSSPFGIAVDQFSNPQSRGGVSAPVAPARPANPPSRPAVSSPRPTNTGNRPSRPANPTTPQRPPSIPVRPDQLPDSAFTAPFNCSLQTSGDHRGQYRCLWVNAEGVLMESFVGPDRPDYFDTIANLATNHEILLADPRTGAVRPFSRPPSTTPSTNPPKPHVGPTDLPPLKPIPDPKPGKVVLPFRLVPVNPPAAAPVKPPKPAVVSNEGDDADLDAMKAALSALIGPLQARIEKLKKDGATDAEIKPLQKQLDDLKKIVSGK